jgi:hypothetical protein
MLLKPRQILGISRFPRLDNSHQISFPASRQRPMCAAMTVRGQRPDAEVDQIVINIITAAATRFYVMDFERPGPAAEFAIALACPRDGVGIDDAHRLGDREAIIKMTVAPTPCHGSGISSGRD